MRKKQAKNFFKAATLASLRCNLSTKGENNHEKIAYTSALHGLHMGKVRIR